MDSLEAFWSHPCRTRTTCKSLRLFRLDQIQRLFLECSTSVNLFNQASIYNDGVWIYGGMINHTGMGQNGPLQVASSSRSESIIVYLASISIENIYIVILSELSYLFDLVLRLATLRHRIQYLDDC